LAQTACRRRAAWVGVVARVVTGVYEVTGRLTQQRHHSGVLPLRDGSECRQDGFVLSEALSAFGLGELVRHDKKVETTLGLFSWQASNVCGWGRFVAALI